MATLLGICQAAVEGVLNAPSTPQTIVGNSSPDAVLLKRCASDVGRELERGWKWQVLEREYTFATVDGTADYDFPDDIRRFSDLTVWDRTGARPLVRVSNISFQALKSGIYVSDVRWYFKVSANRINLNPTPSEIVTIAFNYYTKQFCETSGGTGLDDWAADTDVSRLDDHLMMLGVRQRYLARQGLAFAEEKAEYLKAISDLRADDSPKGIIDVGRIPSQPAEINVPEGSWTLV
jgi:hypothetical protein